jgi:hypothetical protein
MGPLVIEAETALFERMRATADAHLTQAPRRRRVQMWETAFAQFLADRGEQPFEWGRSDCCLFACDGIHALTGIDPAAWFRGRYSDMRGAVAALREYSDGGDLEAVAERIASEYDFDEIAIPFVQRGDCVLIETAHGSALALQADHRIAAQGPASLMLATDVRVMRAWAV